MTERRATRHLAGWQAEVTAIDTAVTALNTAVGTTAAVQLHGRDLKKMARKKRRLEKKITRATEAIAKATVKQAALQQLLQQP